MPVTVNWYVENKIILVEGIGNMTIGDIAFVINRNIELANLSGNDAIYLVYDVSQLKSLPTIGQLIRQLTQMPQDDRFKLAIIVGINNVMMNTTISIASRFTRQLFRNFKTQEAAFTFLRHYDPSINWETPENLEE